MLYRGAASTTSFLWYLVTCTQRHVKESCTPCRAVIYCSKWGKLVYLHCGHRYQSLWEVHTLLANCPSCCCTCRSSCWWTCSGLISYMEHKSTHVLAELLPSPKTMWYLLISCKEKWRWDGVCDCSDREMGWNRGIPRRKWGLIFDVRWQGMDELQPDCWGSFEITSSWKTLWAMEWTAALPSVVMDVTLKPFAYWTKEHGRSLQNKSSTIATMSKLYLEVWEDLSCAVALCC